VTIAWHLTIAVLVIAQLTIDLLHESPLMGGLVDRERTLKRMLLPGAGRPESSILSARIHI
jgi:hypothetical protein